GDRRQGPLAVALLPRWQNADHLRRGGAVLGLRRWQGTPRLRGASRPGGPDDLLARRPEPRLARQQRRRPTLGRTEWAAAATWGRAPRSRGSHYLPRRG